MKIVWCCAAALTVTLTACTGHGATPGPAFPPLAPAKAPPGWHTLTLPNGTAVLAYPPTLQRVISDKDAVSVARTGADGAYLLYLNATPRQGEESLRNWAAFRVHLLAEDDAATAHQDAHAPQLAFLGGSGSCVIDDYVTRIGAHHYKELACLVQGRHGASVIVAAAPAALWPRARLLLERAVMAYRVR